MLSSPGLAFRPILLAATAFCLSLFAAWAGVLWSPLGKVSADEKGQAGHGSTDAEPNRLAGESSPYLLLHQYNPVDWYPWGPEALEKARKEDKPIFLSVGYSTCYWCHVMERESFSNPEIAALMNRYFVNIKVDREERPDLDEIYMLASQVLSRGRGGWPNSVFLTPDLKPFFGGTYFPPEDRYGRPGFRTVVNGIHEAWTERRAQLEQHAGQVAETLWQISSSTRGADKPLPTAGPATAARDQLIERFDAENGGFGDAPKFPTPSNLLLLLHFKEHKNSREVLGKTLDHMARGGIYDQVGGGFHRYSTDAQWRVPHFEKMLYDNGSLLEVYALWFELHRDPQSARVLRQTAAFLARELTAPEGGLWSAIDAETDTREGAFYVWRSEELQKALSAEDLKWVAPVLGADGEPDFRDPHAPNDLPTFVLHLPEPLDQVAISKEVELPALQTRLDSIRARLLEVRAERKRPLTDDKVLADWNGLGIAGLAQAGRVLDDPTIVKQAERAAAFVLEHLRPEGRAFQHVWRGGHAKLDAFLADYAYFVHGLLELHGATGNQRWLRAAIDLSSEQIDRLWDAQGGGFFVAASAPDLLFRSKDPSDGARPSANGMALLNLLRLSRLDDDARWKDLAVRMAESFASQAAASPAGHTTLARALETLGNLPIRASISAGSAVEGLEAEARSKVEITATRVAGAVLAVRLKIAPGWHVNANPASDEFLVPTSLRSGGKPLDGVDYPPGESLDAAYAEHPIQVYAGEVEIKAGEIDSSAEFEIEFQACDHQRCLKPVIARVEVVD